MQAPSKKPAPHEGTHGAIGLSYRFNFVIRPKTKRERAGFPRNHFLCFYNFGHPVTGFHHLSLVGMILAQAEWKVNVNLMKAEQKDLIPDKLSHLLKKRPNMKN